MNNTKTAIGVIHLPTELYCHEDALKRYEIKAFNQHIIIHFPRYKKDNDDLCAPEGVKNYIKNVDELYWGQRIFHTSAFNGFVVKTIIIECDQKDVQEIYIIINKWIGRFITYFLVCSKQDCLMPNSNSTRGNYVDFFGSDGRIRPEDKTVSTITLNATLPSKELFVHKDNIYKAFEYASSTKTIYPSYEFLLNSYKAARDNEHRLAIINACIAMELCFIEKVKNYCNEHRIRKKILLGKYKSLTELRLLMEIIDPKKFNQNLSQKVKDAIDIRNQIVHGDKNLYPTSEDVSIVVNIVEEVLKEYYNDFYSRMSI